MTVRRKRIDMEINVEKTKTMIITTITKKLQDRYIKTRITIDYAQM